MNSETATSALGVAFVVVGFAMLFVPGFASVFDANELFLSLIGLGFALQTVRVVNARRRTPYEQAETADPEIAQELPTPGDDFDDLMDQAAAVRYSGDQRDAVRERLHAAAVAVVVRTEGLSREQAVERVENGSWTDDPYAAAFFTGEISGTSVLQRVSLFDRSRSQFERWATHAAREIAELSEDER
ncbi:hypothetical protein [Halorubellus sp. PRR65]|uniref:DUF7269 family protein n=1 Tax=Halorubellus sp. PRR65 TaxID=3098148 RepID=UPI002B258B4A|nr:hypothetical protein [Halorubellus sp. PRR65]